MEWQAPDCSNYDAKTFWQAATHLIWEKLEAAATFMAAVESQFIDFQCSHADYEASRHFLMGHGSAREFSQVCHDFIMRYKGL